MVSTRDYAVGGATRKLVVKDLRRRNKPRKESNPGVQGAERPA